MLYDRKIKYLDYYEGGTKVNGGGFAKLEVRENTLRIELTIRGLHPTDSFERDIVLRGAEKEEILGQIRIQNGFGQFRCSCGVDQGIGGTGISYSDLRGIRISIGGTREILCQWDSTPDKRQITPPEENAQKSKSALQETKRKPIVESYTDNKMDSEAPVYTENEQQHELKPVKTEKGDEKRKEAIKEEYKDIEDKDRKEENKEDTDWVRQGDENREGQEERNRGNKDRERQENKSREDENRERQEDAGWERQEDAGRERQEDEDRERQEGKNRERQEDEDRKDKDGEGIGNNEYKEDIKKDIEKKESIERDNKGLEINEEDTKNDIQSRPTEMQAQEVTTLSDVISPQLPKEHLQTVFPSEEQSEDRTKDKPDMMGKNPADQPDVRKAPVKLMEDKWQQLSAIYPHIQPFRDERDYLSLTPSDFVLFPDRFYRAVNNSFLLHGYYNYHHLILARIERRGEIIYYIGVPGNYFEREKQVAIMFGFESFECETEPAKTGDFGYYMMRTEL